MKQEANLIRALENARAAAIASILFSVLLIYGYWVSVTRGTGGFLLDLLCVGALYLNCRLWPFTALNSSLVAQSLMNLRKDFTILPHSRRPVV
jgi:hypothetical protein